MILEILKKFLPYKKQNVIIDNGGYWQNKPNKIIVKTIKYDC